VDDLRAAADGVAQEVDEFVERVRLGADGIDDDVVAPLAECRAQRREVDVVQQDVFPAEDDRRSHDCERHAALGQSAFDARPAGRVEEESGVGNGVVEPHDSVGEAHPVRVVEGPGALERLRERDGIVEAVASHLEVGAERVGPVRVVRQGADRSALGDEAFGQVPARGAECTGDDVHAIPPERVLWAYA